MKRINIEFKSGNRRINVQIDPLAQKLLGNTDVSRSMAASTLLMQFWQHLHPGEPFPLDGYHIVRKLSEKYGGSNAQAVSLAIAWWRGREAGLRFTEEDTEIQANF